MAPEIARLQGIALASVFQTVISEAGRRTVDGQTQAHIAEGLYTEVELVLDELDRWFGGTTEPAPTGGSAPPAAAVGAGPGPGHQVAPCCLR